MDYLGKNNSINNGIGQCKNILRSYYNIPEIESIYLFNIYIKKNNQKIILEAILNSNKIYTLLDLDLCENIFNVNEKLINCSEYSIESIINGECLSCKEGYYPLYIESTSTINQFIKCFRSIVAPEIKSSLDKISLSKACKVKSNFDLGNSTGIFILQLKLPCPVEHR